MKFPFKLYEILRNAEKNGQSSIISWLPDGTSFKVHKQREFEEKIMSVHFNQTKFKSFQRQLNLWGFKWYYGMYYHKFFLRDQKEMCRRMMRKQPIRAMRKAKTTTEIESEQTSQLNDQIQTVSHIKSSQVVPQNRLIESQNDVVAYNLNVMMLGQQFQILLTRGEKLLDTIANIKD